MQYLQGSVMSCMADTKYIVLLDTSDLRKHSTISLKLGKLDHKLVNVVKKNVTSTNHSILNRECDLQMGFEGKWELDIIK